MWRSKLYSDVKVVLHLGPSSLTPDTHSDNPSSSSTKAAFSTHKFILATRSPYFAQILLNPGGFKMNDTDEIELPSPPFTPASLHFCLGYMYAIALARWSRI